MVYCRVLIVPPISYPRFVFSSRMAYWMDPRMKIGLNTIKVVIMDGCVLSKVRKGRLLCIDIFSAKPLNPFKSSAILCRLKCTIQRVLLFKHIQSVHPISNYYFEGLLKYITAGKYIYNQKGLFFQQSSYLTA